MMEVNRRPMPIDESQAAESRRHLPDHGDPRAGTSQTGLGEGMRSGTFSLGHDLSGEREQAFARRLGHALASSEERQEPPVEDLSLRVLASAGFGLPALPLAANLPDAAAPETPRFEALVSRVEKALATRMTEVLPGTVSMSLDLADFGTGLRDVTITMSATGIDLVLSRSAAIPDSAYLQAAQVLADRLHARFPRRSVRVLEVEPSAPAPSQGLAALSRLLDPSGEVS